MILLYYTGCRGRTGQVLCKQTADSAQLLLSSTAGALVRKSAVRLHFSEVVTRMLDMTLKRAQSDQMWAPKIANFLPKVTILSADLEIRI